MSSEEKTNKPTIAIIDDNQTVRNAIAKLLQQGGYDNLHFAENGQEGLTLVKKISPVVIILDIDMPVMNGVEFLETIELKPTDPYIIIVLTANIDNEIMKKCYELGVNFFLRKPCNVVEINGVVKRSIEIKMTENLIKEIVQQRVELKNDLKNKEMEEKLRQADKMASLGTLAAGVAHDVNNPLCVATGDVHLMKRDFGDIQKFLNHILNITMPFDEAKNIEKLKEDMDLSHILENFWKKLSRCEEAMERIKVIVESLKNFSRSDEGEIIDIDINKEIESSLRMIPKRYKRGINITTEFSSLSTISCYGGQIGQVFINIIVNALQAMNGEGILNIETLSDNKSIIIKIRDSGPGIPDNKLKQIFNSFYTTKPKGEGTGLGLSICKSIIENHKGEISVKNNDDRGVTFTIKLLKDGVR